MSEAIVFDAEPILAYLDDEPGSDAVEEWIDRVAGGEIDGYISPVTKTEILYVGSRIGFAPDDVRASLNRLEELGVEVRDPTDCWETAAVLKEAYSMALGDAYALATAEAVDGTLLAGADDDFDGVDAEIERFRDEPA
ncbi:Predicted nucleic acid-binding protein, contains PIN domain [Natronoarchaeum philippinense]|uniref:Predicted nucleic acid-binding protein, contains PIN domain n=1 Tax=Natronoarchaeum philippinense TaxID=558529 RepID=A0A285P5I2_NATPI|nr:PIN domain-containing protein [Natronoarchaeum philippinense]SNZ16975.1 Predicted nucleic acid-binding protein, contains PIN domain [Natronoarchaeum philippinense]